MGTQGKKSRRSKDLVALRYTSVFLCPSRIAPFSLSLSIWNWLWPTSDARHILMRSGIPWKCTFSRPSTSITCPPPPPPMLTNGHTCRPDFPAAPMTRILLPSHVDLPPAASSAGHLFHNKAFKTTVGCKEKRLSLKPIVVATWKCVIKKLMK